MEMTEAAKKHWLKANYPIEVMNAGSKARIAYLRGIVGGTVNPATGKTIVEGAKKGILETARGLRGFPSHNWGKKMLGPAGRKFIWPLALAGGIGYGARQGFYNINPAQIREIDIITDRIENSYINNRDPFPYDTAYGKTPGIFDPMKFDPFRNMGDK